MTHDEEKKHAEHDRWFAALTLVLNERRAEERRARAAAQEADERARALRRDADAASEARVRVAEAVARAADDKATVHFDEKTKVIVVTIKPENSAQAPRKLEFDPPKGATPK